MRFSISWIATFCKIVTLSAFLLIGCTDSPEPTPTASAIGPTATLPPSPTPTNLPPSTATATTIPAATDEATATSEPDSLVDVTAWEEDLAYFKERLESFHPNPYYRFSEDEYVQALEQLRQNLPTMNENEIIVELARIVAFIDGHSAMRLFDDPVNFHLYGLQFYSFSDGIYLINGREPYNDLIGGRLVQVGDRSIIEVVDLITPYIPNDNPMTIAQRLPYWLIRGEVLTSLGIIPAVETPQFLIEMADGSQITVNPERLSFAEYRAWVDGPVAGLPKRSDTLYLSRSDERNWFTYLEESGTLFIQYNQVLGSVDSLVRGIEELLEGEEVERVVLDIRLNGGGNNTRFSGLLNLLSTHPQINRPGHFFTILGRQTFSAAANFATELENRTHTIFVGEPMGGSPNLYGDAAPFTLPNSRLRINVSTRYWEFSTPEDDRVWIAPDIPAPLSSNDFFNGQDPSLKAILDFTSVSDLRSGNNPLLTPLVTNEWETDDLRDPYVVEVDGTFYMFYAGRDAEGNSAIGYATSRNGRKWFRSPENPIFSATGTEFDGGGVAAPVVTIVDGVWTLYYAASSESDGRTTAIGKATAAGPEGPWSRSEQPILQVGSDPAWDSLSITPGSVIRSDGIYWLYYSGFSASRNIGIGLATSDDGVVWTKYDDPTTTNEPFTASDPVLTGAESGIWDEIVWAPFVQKIDQRWEMYYHGDPISTRGSLEIGIGLAGSDDGLNWTRSDEPLLYLTDGARFAHTPFAIQVGDFIFLYYASVALDGSGGQLELTLLRAP